MLKRLEEEEEGTVVEEGTLGDAKSLEERLAGLDLGVCCNLLTVFVSPINYYA